MFVFLPHTQGNIIKSSYFLRQLCKGLHHIKNTANLTGARFECNLIYIIIADHNLKTNLMIAEYHHYTVSVNYYL